MNITFKRFSAYLLNKLIMILAVHQLFWFLMYRFEFLRNYMIDIPGVQPSGITWLDYTLCNIFLPYSIVYMKSGNHSIERKVLDSIPILIIIICYIVIDTIISFTFQGDLGKKIFGLSVYNSNKKAASILQFLVRSIIKYISITFLPFLLAVPLLNKKRLALHDVIAKTIVGEAANIQASNAEES